MALAKNRFVPNSIICLFLTCTSVKSAPIKSFTSITLFSTSSSTSSSITFLRLSDVPVSFMMAKKDSRSSSCWAIFCLINSQSSVHTIRLCGRKSSSETFCPEENCVSTLGMIFTINNFLSLNCVSGSKMRILSISLPNNSILYGFSFP